MKPIIKNDDLKREREDFTARLNEQIDEPPKGIFSNLDDHKFSSKNFPARMAVPLFHKKSRYFEWTGVFRRVANGEVESGIGRGNKSVS